MFYQKASDIMAHLVQKQISQEVKYHLLQLLNEVKVPYDFEVKKFSSYKYINNVYVESRSFIPTRKLKAYEQQIKSRFDRLIKTKLKVLQDQGKNQVANQLENFILEVEQTQGDKYTTTSSLEKHNENNIEAIDQDYKNQDGLVTLVQFWVQIIEYNQATWCGHSYALMKNNEKMLKRNQFQWAGKFKFVAILLDREHNTLIKYINDEDRQQINHYRMNEGWNYETELLMIDQIPFVTLLDKNGTIVYMGQPNQCEIEDEINRLIQNPYIEQQAIFVQEDLKVQEDQEEDFTKSKNFLRNTWRTFQDSIKNQSLDEYINLSLNKSYIFDTSGQKSSHSRGILEIEFKTNIAQYFQAIQGSELIKNSLKQRSYQFKLLEQQVINYPQYQNHVRFMGDLAKKYNLALELIVGQGCYIDISQPSNTIDSDDSPKQGKKIIADVSLNLQTLEEMQAYYQLNEETNIEQFSTLMMNGYDFQLYVGERCYDITNIHSLNISENETISNVQGQVLVVVFWDYNDPECYCCKLQ